MTNLKDDLDLSVLPPGGNLIWYGSKNDTVTGGSLDVDIQPSVNGTNVENVNFISTPPAGTYEVCVTNFRQSADADEYTLEAFENNKKKFSTTRTTLDGNKVCDNYVYPKGK
jgi:uncharacterized protein YfaP (DUF2135 family)